MALYKADTPPISDSLSENPHLMYTRRNTVILKWATNHSITGFELQHQILTDAFAGVPILRLPEYPPRFAENTSAATLSNWKYDTYIAVSAEALIKQFKLAILVSLGPLIEREFPDPLRCHIDYSIHKIFAFVRTGYETVTEADVLR